MIECLRVLRSKSDDVAIERRRRRPAANELGELDSEILSESVGWLAVSAAHWRKAGSSRNVAMS